jgi:hypothetical protein
VRHLRVLRQRVEEVRRQQRLRVHAACTGSLLGLRSREAERDGTGVEFHRFVGFVGTLRGGRVKEEERDDGCRCRRGGRRCWKEGCGR